MLKCAKCGVVKDESEFPKNKSKRSGYNSDCKACRRKYNKELWQRIRYKYAKGGEKFKPYTPLPIEQRKPRIRIVKTEDDIRRARERRIAYGREYRKRNAQVIMEKHREYAEKYPERMLAAKAVQDAVKRKELKPARKQKCADCGQKAQHLHHESYAPDKWLVVIPLCRSCHMKRHMSSKV